MTWDILEKKEVSVSPEQFWKPAKEIEHTQGLKILCWGDAEVGKEVSSRLFDELLDYVSFLFQHSDLSVNLSVSLSTTTNLHR